jgi:type I restriction enzyme S subunit
VLCVGSGSGGGGGAMSRFKPYPKYKDSGVEWLGEVPKHWVLKRLGHYFHERIEKVSDADYEPLSVTKNGIVPRLETAAKTQDGDNRKKVSKGDFVINSRSDRKGSSGLSPLDGSVSLICTVLVPDDISGKFVHHLLRSVAFQEEYYRYGKGIVADLWSTNFSEMKNILLAVPPEVEQVAIAQFLQDEIVRMDALIAEQQRLIELLKEKRQAVSSHAMTKGLDPTVPMKDSGVKWLGQVPAHWAITRLSYVANVLTGFPFPSASFSHDDSDVRLLRGVNVGINSLKWDEAVYWNVSNTAEYEKFAMRPGQIVVGMDRPWISEGLRIARVSDADMPCLLLQRVAGISAEPMLNDKFLYSLLSSSMFKSYIEPDLTGVSVPHISPEQILSFTIPLPPVSEQGEIASYLEAQERSIASLIEQANTSVQFLQERRSALISATVTGKIDVREWNAA